MHALSFIITSFPFFLLRFDLPSSTSSSSSLNPLDLSVHRLYGSMFAAYVDTTAGTFLLYHLEKEQVGREEGKEGGREGGRED